MTALVEKIEALLGPLPPPLRAAILAVDRARFVRPCDRALAAENWPLPLDTAAGNKVPPAQEILDRHGSWLAALAGPEFAGAVATISAPSMYPLAFHLLGLAEGDRLLELGAGTGYGAALAAHVVGARGLVTSVEVDPHLVAEARANTADLPQVRIEHADGLARPDLAAACTHAWLTFSVPEVPSALVDALPEGGVLLAPVGPPPLASQRWLRFERRNRVIVETAQPFPVVFIPARAFVPG
jgi:protein-L-isoaspartate(D-aspartate) O-methyltransferase